MYFISMRLCVYVEFNVISSKSKHSLSDKETSRKKVSKKVSYKKYLRNTKNKNQKQYVKISKKQF